jgi:hypothetical protein
LGPGTFEIGWRNRRYATTDARPPTLASANKTVSFRAQVRAILGKSFLQELVVRWITPLDFFVRGIGVFLVTLKS